tara:strand:- start:177 stop:1019 length:843 start_codon:yes stop_codon:yes gene_type:complete
MIDQELKKFIEEALKEDIQTGDHTSLACIDKKNSSKVKLIAKDKGIIAGIELANLIFKIIDNNLKVKNNFYDGDNVSNQDIIMSIEGSTHSILKAERLVLNYMQLMSAIATKTNRLCKKIASTNTKILDTRKTIPLNRKIQKWAVKIGGGKNHRFALDDMIMIKDNHIDFCGGISEAIQETKKYLKTNKLDLNIIVETRNINEIKKVINEGGITRILLDNFNYEETKEAVKYIDSRFETESSGGITEDNILKYAECGVDFISLGTLTHTIQNFDLSLKAL